MKWQPIETAPKDGTGIIVTDGDIIGQGVWHCGLWYFWESDKANSCLVLLPEDSEYEWVIDPNCWVRGYGPTHWMPLPSPPEKLNA